MTTGVRPLDVEPEPPRRGAFLAGTALVALAGFGVYLASGGLSVGTTSTTAGTITSTTTTVPAGTGLRAGGEELRSQVPGFQGRVRGVLTVDDGELDSAAWTWSSGEADPRTVPLPDEASGTWDSSLNLLAVVAESSFGRSLYYGPPTNIREVFNDVESFAWHATEPSTVAFVTVPQPDGMRELWRSIPADSTVAQGTFNASRVTRFDFEASLVAYGDWGFALSTPSEERPLQLITLGPDGSVVAQASFGYVDDFGDGRLLLMAQPQGANPHLAIVDVGLGDAEPIGPDAVFGAVLSPNKRWVASVSILSSGATLWLGNDEQSVEQSIPLGVDVAFPVDWSSDGRWILLRGSPDAPADSDGTQLIFVDAGSQDVHVVTTPGTVSGLTIEATGTPGPTFFFVPA